MKFLVSGCLTLIVCLSVAGQKTNDAIQKQIKSLKAEKTIFLSYDGSSSKLMGVASNFSDSETKAAGVEAMNFAMAFFYVGQTLTAPPDRYQFHLLADVKEAAFRRLDRPVGSLAIIRPAQPRRLSIRCKGE